MNHPVKLMLLGLAATLSACSSLQSEKIEYKSASKAPSLSVPPDLTQLSKDNRYNVAGGPVSASAYQGGRAASAQSSNVAVNSVADVRMARDGNRRWLVVQRPAQRLWDPVREFWKDNGFVLTTEQQDLGIMETDWAENRAKIPEGFIRNTIGKLLDALYSTGERDRFRTRLERNQDGSTEIFVSHKGMVEVYKDDQKTQTTWQPRPADPELEAEFLNRLMLKLGLPVEQAKAQLAAANATAAATQSVRLATRQNLPVLELDEGFDRAWRRVGLALDRTGFTVEDRDRNQGLYFVRFIDATPVQKDTGFLSRLFASKNNDGTLVKYRVQLKSEAQGTTVSVLDANGAPDASANAQRIVQIIADDLK